MPESQERLQTLWILTELMESKHYMQITRWMFGLGKFGKYCEFYSSYFADRHCICFFVFGIWICIRRFIAQTCIHPYHIYIINWFLIIYHNMKSARATRCSFEFVSTMGVILVELFAINLTLHAHLCNLSIYHCLLLFNFRENTSHISGILCTLNVHWFIHFKQKGILPSYIHAYRHL